MLSPYTGHFIVVARVSSSKNGASAPIANVGQQDVSIAQVGMLVEFRVNEL
jgi:hypothetical protein